MVSYVEQVVGNDVLLQTLGRYRPGAKASVCRDNLWFCFGANLWQGHMGSSSKCSSVSACSVFRFRSFYSRAAVSKSVAGYVISNKAGVQRWCINLCGTPGGAKRVVPARTVFTSSPRMTWIAPDKTWIETSIGWVCMRPSHPGEISTSFTVNDTAPWSLDTRYRSRIRSVVDARRTSAWSIIGMCSSRIP